MPGRKVNKTSANFHKLSTVNLILDSCERDSGGSLYFKENGRLYTVGIVSYGKPCDLDGAAVATRVNHYIW